MRRALVCFRAAAVALLPLCGAAIRAPGDVVVQASTVTDSELASAPAPLAPAVEAKLAVFLAKAKVEKEKIWNQRMTSEIAAMMEVAKLDPAQAKALEDPARQAVAAQIDSWTDAAKNQFRSELAQLPAENAAMTLQQAIAQVEVVARNDWSADVKPPFEADVWQTAVRRTLSPDQAAAWSKAQSDRDNDIQKQIADPLKNAADRTYDQQLQEALAACRAIELAVNLPKDRSDKLDAYAKDVAGQTRDLWHRKAERLLLDMSDDQRRAAVQNGNVFIGVDPNDFPTRQPGWKQGLATILTPDEMRRYEEASKIRQAKRIEAMSGILVSVLDDKVAFSEAQRQKLEPLAERVVKNTPQLFPDSTQPFYAVQTQLLFSTAAKIPEADLKAILNESQLRHWNELTKPEAPAPSQDSAGDAMGGTGEPEDVERAISLFLFNKAEEERRQMIEENLLKVEDVARAVKLGADETATLEAAARGTAEESLATWKWYAEQQVRGQLQGLPTPQNIKQRLAGLQDFFAQRNFFVNRGNRPTIWDETVKSTLSAPQMELWNKEIDARAAFRDQAVASLVLTFFDAKYHLSDDQWKKLEPLIAGNVHDYNADISQMFSGGSNPPWYLISQFSLMPFTGIADTDLKAILTKEQMDQWTGSQECANGTMWWNNVKQMHKQRIDAMNNTN